MNGALPDHLVALVVAVPHLFRKNMGSYVKPKNMRTVSHLPPNPRSGKISYVARKPSHGFRGNPLGLRGDSESGTMRAEDTQRTPT